MDAWRRRQDGVSLIEVMVAVLVFSLGLLGLAGLQVVAARSSQAAYLRSQVVFLATDMAERMRANAVGVWMGAYDGDAYPGTQQQDCGVACDPSQLAVYDRYKWSRQLVEFLPAGVTAAIHCDRGSAGYDPVANGQLGLRPPYGGTCRMRISWAERGAGDSRHGDAAQRSLAWTFQP